MSRTNTSVHPDIKSFPSGVSSDIRLYPVIKTGMTSGKNDRMSPAGSMMTNKTWITDHHP